MVATRVRARKGAVMWVGASGAIPCKSLKRNGGDDGTRTRGLCRDRAATTSKSLKSNGVGSHSFVRQEILSHCYRPLNVPISHCAQSPEAAASLTMQQYGFPRCHRRNLNP